MTIISIVQIVISCLLIIGVLLQQRGSGLGMAFGGDNSVYATKRGAEKVIVIMTIILAAAFMATSILSLVLAKS